MTTTEAVRQRKQGTNGGVKGVGSSGINLKKKDAASVSLVDIVRLVGGLILLNGLLSYFITNDVFFWGRRPWFTKPAQVASYLKGPILMTDKELQAYDGKDPTKPIYIALNGTIYDVTAGARVYGPGGSYSIFAGKDAARAFVTGCFLEDGHPDMRGAEWTYVPADIPGFNEPATPAQKSQREQALRNARKQVKATIDSWQKVFRGETGKDYFEIGLMKRPKGWQEMLPEPKLCKQAQDARPKSSAAPKDPGAAYRGGRP